MANTEIGSRDARLISKAFPSAACAMAVEVTSTSRVDVGVSDNSSPEEAREAATDIAISGARRGLRPQAQSSSKRITNFADKNSLQRVSYVALLSFPAAEEVRAMLISVDALVSNVVKITPQLAGAIRNFRAEVTYCKGAMDALTIGHTHLRKTGYRHHSLHPAYTTEDAVTHPDHLAAAAAVLHDRVRAVRSRKPAEECASLEVATGDSVLLVGGPAWEGVTRAVFGYEQAGRGLACKGLGVELPYRWHVDAEAIHAKAVRFVKTPKGFRTEEEPNWGIVGPRGRRYFPTVGHDGFLVTDYLLLTKLPNFLGEESYGSEQVIVNFGGAHGIGQRAAELLLSRRDVVRKVAEVLDIDVHRAATWPAAYQALFRVGDISHGVVRGSRARDIVLVDAVRITESPEWWHTWANGVHASLRRWS